MANILNVVNTIIKNDLKDSRIPEATKSNFSEVGNAILSYSSTTNSFVNSLVNKIAFTIVQNKIYNNPLSELKKGKKPFGKDIEHTHTNPAKAESYSIENANQLLKTVRPDVVTEYFRLNRQDQYSVSISRQELKHAFTSIEEMSRLIDSIKNSLLSGDNIDEFILMKSLYNDAVKDDKLSFVVIEDNATSKDIFKAIKNLSSAFKFPNTEYCAYNKIYANDIKSKTKNARLTWAPVDEQVAILRSDILNDINIDVLASVFNLEKSDYNTRIIEVDNFNGVVTKNTKKYEIIGVIQDSALTQIWDDENYLDEFYNAKVGTYNYYWNHWQTMALSVLANGIALVKEVTV